MMLKRILSLTLFSFIIISFSICLYFPAAGAFTGEDMINIVLDPGHGGKDSGAIGTYYEKYYTLKVAEACAAKLRANGSFNVYMTRTTDGEYLSLLERGMYGDRVNADIIVSLHFNSSTDTSQRGIEVYSSVLNRFDLSGLAASVGNKLAAATGLPNRGCYRRYDTEGYYWSEKYQWDVQNDPSVGGLSDYYGIITWAAKFGYRGMIIEHAYISNGYDLGVCNNVDMLRKMGEADADAIIAYYTNHAHSYTAGYVMDYPVSCFSAGKQSIQCTVCGHRKSVVSLAAAPDPEAHFWAADEEIKATCQHGGSAGLYCRYTRNLVDKGATSYTEHTKKVETPPLDHNYVTTEHREKTCTVDGIDRAVCSMCGDERVEIYTATGHVSEKLSHSDPTCTLDGEDRYRCSVCGEEYADVIPATGHVWVKLSRTEPTCTEEGTEEHECSVCKERETLPLPALGHDLVEQTRIDATCTEEGSVLYLCSRCGAEITETLEALGHDFEEVKVDEPTCLEDGVKHSICKRCEEKLDEPIKALGHDYVLKKTEEFCEKEGAKTFECSRCGDSYKEAIPPMGHKYVEAARVEATEEKEGYVRFSCKRCGDEYTEVIPKIGETSEITETSVETSEESSQNSSLSSETIALIAGAVAAVAAALAIIIPKTVKSGNKHKDLNKSSDAKESDTVGENDDSEEPKDSEEKETSEEATETEDNKEKEETTQTEEETEEVK